MPFQEPVKNRKISREMLNFYTGDKSRNALKKIINATASVAVLKGDTLEIKDDAATIANCESSGVIGVAQNKAEIGETVEAIWYGVATIRNTSFEVGKVVYLLPGATEPTTDAPNFTQSGYFRKIGYAISNNIIELTPELRTYIE